MPRKPIEHDPDAEAVIYVRVSGAVKNEIVRFAESQGLSVSGWAASVLWFAAREGRGLPGPAVAVAPVPDASVVLRAYALGESVLVPCGRVGSCEGVVSGGVVVGGLVWCGVCGVRFS